MASGYTGKPYVALAKAMRLLRDMKGLSLRQHAKQIGLSPATLSRIERSYGCDLSKLVLIHEKTGVSYEILLGDK
jgi:transcriptional regulator with XRE-family HTH domain